MLIQNKKRWLIVFISVALATLFLAVISLLNEPSSQPESTVAHPPLPKDLEQDYSSLNKVIPGKSTLSDVKEINGEPESVSRLGDNTYMFYLTPLRGFKNTVFLKGDVVAYSEENVFGSYRGTFESLTTTYGSPSLILYDKETDYPWYIYLDRGIGFLTDERDVLIVIYFVPQDKQSFIEDVAKDLKLSETPTEDTEPVFRESP